MKVVILAGGLGTRLSEETHKIPKPMVEIGGKPILWHIMKIYSYYGFKEFIICLGYKGYIIKEWFANYFLHNSDITIDIKNNNIEVHNKNGEDWKVTLIDTGLNTGTAGRLKKVAKYIGNETFMMTYGDGVSDINIKELVNFHKSHGKLATVTAVQPENRFGVLEINDYFGVDIFKEKQDNVDNWINGGFFVLEPDVINYIESNDLMWEQLPLKKLVETKNLFAYKHKGFWMAMDKLYDKIRLENMIKKDLAKWMIWKKN